MILKSVEEKFSLDRGSSEENAEPSELIQPSEIEKDSEEDKFQLQLLTGDNINYKKALQHLSYAMNFKINYQSVQKVFIIIKI